MIFFVCVFLPSVLFHYAPDSSGKGAEEIVGNFQGYLQTDGYAGYNTLGERATITHAGCLALVRRKFIETAKACGLNPSDYLLHVFEKSPCAQTKDDLKTLLPRNRAVTNSQP